VPRPEHPDRLPVVSWRTDVSARWSEGPRCRWPAGAPRAHPLMSSKRRPGQVTCICDSETGRSKQLTVIGFIGSGNIGQYSPNGSSPLATTS
jgi:hypothetical protein